MDIIHTSSGKKFLYALTKKKKLLCKYLFQMFPSLQNWITRTVGKNYN